MQKNDDKFQLLDEVLADRKFEEDLKARCLTELQSKQENTSLRRALIAVAAVVVLIGGGILVWVSPLSSSDSRGVAGLTVVHTHLSSLPESLRTPPSPSLPEKVSDAELLALMKGRSCALVSRGGGRKILLMLDEQADIML
jgi:hypothetical protein